MSKEEKKQEIKSMLLILMQNIENDISNIKKEKEKIEEKMEK